MKRNVVTWKMVVRESWRDFLDDGLPVLGILTMLGICGLIGVAVMCGYFAYLYEPLEGWFVQIGALMWPGMMKGLIGSIIAFFLPLGASVGFAYLFGLLICLGADLVATLWSRRKCPPIIPSCLSA